IISADNIHELPPIVLLQSVRRDRQRVGDDRGCEVDVNERSRPELTLLVRKYRLELNCPGSRGRLVTDRQQRADIELLRTALIIDRRLNRAARHGLLDRG